MATARLFAYLGWESVVVARRHADQTYKGFHTGVSSGVDLEMGLLVETLVAIGHAALVFLLRLHYCLGFVFLLEVRPKASEYEWVGSLPTWIGCTRCGAGFCLDWMAFMSVSTSVEKWALVP